MTALLVLAAYGDRIIDPLVFLVQQPYKVSSTLLPRSFTRRAETRRSRCTRMMSSSLYAARFVVLVFIGLWEGSLFIAGEGARQGAHHVWNGLGSKS